MQTSITARHFTISDELRDFINRRFEKLARYSHYIINAEVILARSATLEQVEAKLHLSHELLTAKAEAKDLYMAASEVIDRLLTQLKRHDERMRDRKKNGNSSVKEAVAGSEKA